WDNAASGNLEARAKAYLDNNCAHCHQPGGTAEASGLHLGFTQTDLRKLGACKMPNSAGYSGGHQYDVVPGNPAESIMIFRMKSTKAKEMMPEIGRSLSHKEGTVLVREWLATLKGGCGDGKTAAN
ncbi:MAG: c-type cytochrome, partial [Acidobacteriota bacterium]